MRRNKNQGFCINCVLRTLISISLLIYASCYPKRGRKFPGSSNRIDWWSNGYYSCLRDIENSFLVKRHAKKTCNNIIREEFTRISRQTRGRNIRYIDRDGGLIVVECMNKTAADELAKRIAANISATFIEHPTKRLKPLLDKAKRHIQLTYAIETLSHYDAALRILDDISWKSFVLSRYWYYSAMLAIGRSTLNRATVPGRRHSIYNWPRDLLVPDVVLFLKYPAYPITDNMTIVEKLNHIDIASRAIKALLRFVFPKVFDLYGDNLYGEIDPFERSMEIIRNKYNYLIDTAKSWELWNETLYDVTERKYLT